MSNIIIIVKYSFQVFLYYLEFGNSMESDMNFTFLLNIIGHNFNYKLYYFSANWLINYFALFLFSIILIYNLRDIKLFAQYRPMEFANTFVSFYFVSKSACISHDNFINVFTVSLLFKCYLIPFQSCIINKRIILDLNLIMLFFKLRYSVNL